MPVPNTKPGSMFLHFFFLYLINFYVPAVAPINSAGPEEFGTILYGVELFLIFISHNDYGMLENMSRLSTGACNNVIPAIKTLTI
jgi:hypothetical protein